jgi:hypothetical protein
MVDQGTTGTSSEQDPFREAMERARELNEQIVESARAAGEEMLNRYVDWLEDVAEQQRKFAAGPRMSQMDWLAAMLNAQADWTRKFAESVRDFPGRTSQ